MKPTVSNRMPMCYCYCFALPYTTPSFFSYFWKVTFRTSDEFLTEISRWYLTQDRTYLYVENAIFLYQSDGICMLKIQYFFISQMVNKKIILIWSKFWADIAFKDPKVKTARNDIQKYYKDKKVILKVKGSLE